MRRFGSPAVYANTSHARQRTAHTRLILPVDLDRSWNPRTLMKRRPIDTIRMEHFFEAASWWISSGARKSNAAFQAFDASFAQNPVNRLTAAVRCRTASSMS